MVFDFLDWFDIKGAPRLQRYIKKKLAGIANLPPEASGKSAVRERAGRHLLEVLSGDDGGDKDRVARRSEYSNIMAEFSDSGAIEANAVLHTALTEKMCVHDFLAVVRASGCKAYESEVKPLCLIDPQGDLYIDGKPVRKALDPDGEIRIDSARESGDSEALGARVRGGVPTGEQEDPKEQPDGHRVQDVYADLVKF